MDDLSQYDEAQVRESLEIMVAGDVLIKLNENEWAAGLRLSP